mmetsp:Transcript_76401/g.151134  ORF Transcript_76401/g.151134 Transcript_76401/m.151134 type:complete len:86 (-) Transcript_76401:367-624(-)
MCSRQPNMQHCQRNFLRALSDEEYWAKVVLLPNQLSRVPATVADVDAPEGPLLTLKVGPVASAPKQKETRALWLLAVERHSNARK